MSDWLEICLPYPPSVNHYWKHTRQGKHYISKAGREFKRIATEVCSQFNPFESAVEIKMEIYFPDNLHVTLIIYLKGFLIAWSAPD
ncbi:MAG: hypothetical protein E6037_05540 [Haemophilus parainfluenzae]|nr:hypothetical protein [Haemophilus parainfluenzae]